MSKNSTTLKVAFVPAICPLYRLPIWEKLANLKSMDTIFYLEPENNIDNIKYIPKSTLDKKFNWQRVKNTYNLGFFWQKDVIKLAFSSCDVIIFSGNIRCISTWITSILARALGKRVYFWSHGVYGKEGKIALLIKRFFLSIPTGNFFYGNLSLQKVLSWNFSESQNHVIYNSLDYDFHKKMRSIKGDNKIYEHHFQNNDPVLIFIGRLTKIKKLDQFLLAVKKLKNQGLSYNIVLIGDGPEKENLRTISEENHLNTWFYGECYDEEVLHSLIKKSDLCISPGNVGLTLIHCLSYGTPVITHGDFDNQMPEAEAIIPGFNGDFFKKNCIEDLSIRIKKWFVDHIDKDRNTIAENCYSIIDEKYNPYFQSALVEKVLLNNK